MTLTTIFTTFTELPIAIPIKLNMQWFDEVTYRLTGSRILPRSDEVRRTNSPLLNWKDYGNGPVRYENVTAVTFNSLYVTALQTLTDDFSIDGYGKLIQQLIEARKEAKRQNNNTVVLGIKCYLNMIFGQLVTGTIRHSTASANTIVDIGRKQAEAAHSHPQAFYADTDYVLIQGNPVDVKAWLDVVIDPHFKYDLAHYTWVEISMKKRGITYGPEV